MDVTLDYRAFEDGFDPFAEGASRTATRRFSERLKGRVASHVREVVAPALDAAAGRLAPNGRYDIHIGDDGETLRFAYPSAVEAPDSYVASEILLEFGGRNVIEPNERHAIVPDMAGLTDGLDYPTATVTVLSPARTFWEKATLIHAACHRRRLANRPDRLSRHWFDLACLAAHPVGRAALADRALLADVVRHKTVFFHAGNANYDRCPRRPAASRPRRRPAPGPAIGLRCHACRPNRRRRCTGVRDANRGHPVSGDRSESRFRASFVIVNAALASRTGLPERDGKLHAAASATV